MGRALFVFCGAIIQAKNLGRAKLRLSREWRAIPGSDRASPYQEFRIQKLQNRFGGRS
jgi:hypothetical protein